MNNVWNTEKVTHVEGTKVFRNGTIAANQFSFTISAVTDGAPLPTQVTVYATTGGAIAFGNMEYPLSLMSDGNGGYVSSKTFTYRVVENLPTGAAAATNEETTAGFAIRNGIKYDLRPKQITITVNYDVDTGVMTVSPDPETVRFTFTNDQLDSVKIRKSWGNGQQPPEGASIVAKLTAKVSDVPIVDATLKTLTGLTDLTVTLDGQHETTPWEYEWTDLPKYDNNNQVIEYSAAETSYTINGTSIDLATYVPTSDTTVTGLNVVFTNRIPTTDITVTKTWKGTSTWLDEKLYVLMTLKGTVPSDQAGAAPVAVDLTQLPTYTAPGAESPAQQSKDVLLYSGKTYHTWHNLPKYNAAGKPITYTVEETAMYYRQGNDQATWPAINNFNTAFDVTLSQSGTEFTIDNTPKTTQIIVTKVWTQNNVARTDKTDIGYELHKVGADDALTVDAAKISVNKGEREVGKVKYVTGENGGWQTVTISGLPKYELVIDTESGTATATYSPVNYYVTETGVTGDTRVTYQAENGEETETASEANTNDGTITIYNRDAQVDIDVLKVDATNASKTLKDAEFQILKYKDDSEQYVAYDFVHKAFVATVSGDASTQNAGDNSKRKTDDNGTLSFTGLPAGQYKLVETKTPDGYIKVDNNDIFFTISADGAVTWTKADGTTEITETTETGKPSQVGYTPTNNTFTVGNNPGARLPATGGEGTTLYYVLGTLLTLAAVAMMIAKRRRDY